MTHPSAQGSCQAFVSFQGSLLFLPFALPALDSTAFSRSPFQGRLSATLSSPRKDPLNSIHLSAPSFIPSEYAKHVTLMPLESTCPSGTTSALPRYRPFGLFAASGCFTASSGLTHPIVPFHSVIVPWILFVVTRVLPEPLAPTFACGIPRAAASHGGVGLSRDGSGKVAPLPPLAPAGCC